MADRQFLPISLLSPDHFLELKKACLPCLEPLCLETKQYKIYTKLPDQ